MSVDISQQQGIQCDSSSKLHDREKHEQTQLLVESLMNLNATDRYAIAMHLLHSVWSRVNLQDGANEADRKLIRERLAELESGVPTIPIEEVMEKLRRQAEDRATA